MGLGSYSWRLDVFLRDRLIPSAILLIYHERKKKKKKEKAGINQAQDTNCKSKIIL